MSVKWSKRVRHNATCDAWNLFLFHVFSFFNSSSFFFTYTDDYDCNIYSFECIYRVGIVPSIHNILFLLFLSRILFDICRFGISFSLFFFAFSIYALYVFVYIPILYLSLSLPLLLPFRSSSVSISCLLYWGFHS